MPKLKLLTQKRSPSGVFVYEVEIKDFQTNEEMHAYIGILNTKATQDENYKDTWEII